MRRISLKTLFIAIAVIAMLSLPIGWFTRHSATWKPAEKTASMLGDLYGDAYRQGGSEVSTSDVDELLNLPKYEFLKRHRTANINLRDGELAWFSPNSKYSIGLHRDGRRLWIVSGNRVED